MEAGELGLRGMVPQIFSHGHALQSLLAAQFIVEIKEEVPAVVLVILPGVLAVEDDGYQMGPVGHPAPDPVEPVDEVVDRVLVIPLGIHEAHKVRESTVAKHHGNAFVAFSRTVGFVENFRVLHHPCEVPFDMDAEGAGQHAFVRRGPGDAGLGKHGHDLLGNTPLRGPHADGTFPEEFFVIRERPIEVRPRRLRDGQSGSTGR